MKKYVLDLTVVSAERIGERYVLLKLTRDEALPPMVPGQFVEVRIDGEANTMLRRPISINMVDEANNLLWLLVAMVGAGTRRLGSLGKGDCLNCVLPLGRGFSMPGNPNERMLLIGGGVGVAPLLFLGRRIAEAGGQPTFLLGARTKIDLPELDEFNKYGRVCVTTEDGSEGERGFVTQHPVLLEGFFQRIATCGPKPMMQAVARWATKADVECEASLENLMACGLGACLCCVEKTTEGNVCVCTEGPVFNIKKLLWQI